MPVDYVDRFVGQWKRAASANEGHSRKVWKLSVERATAVIDSLGLVAIDAASVEKLRAAFAKDEGLINEVGDGTTYGHACADLAEEVLRQVKL